MSADFAKSLNSYKTQIDADLEKYAVELISKTRQNFGDYPAEPVKAFASLLTRGGKRVRGVLAMVSYKMLGGTDELVALKAARIIEMLHAYILIADDIQDNSQTRRGAPTAHEELKELHKKSGFKGDSDHFGRSIAIDGFLFGLHQAINELADLPVLQDRRLEAIKSVNNHFITTIHGQTQDIFNQVAPRVKESDVNNVLVWKTAYYTFLNPLELGAILAGASKDELKFYKEYSMNSGRVFQITDDIISTFGNSDDSGKNPMDDLREGKQTLLITKALELASTEEAKFLQTMVGKASITSAEFERCKQIITECGALDYARKTAKKLAQEASLAVDKMPAAWSGAEKNFLKTILTYLTTRKN